MNKDDLISEWISDLRGGKFKQRYHALADTVGGRCCLGVLCETYMRLGGELSITTDKGCGRVAYNGEKFRLPSEVFLAAGLNNADGTIFSEVPQEPCSLSLINDYYRWSFTEIADWIQSRPAGLFTVDKWE